MRDIAFLCTIVLVGGSTAACGADTTGVFGNSSDSTAASTASSTTSGAGGQGGATGATSTSSGSGGSTSSTTSSGSTTSAGTGGAGVGGGGQGGAGTSSSSGQGGSPPLDIGCSDGTREYYIDIAAQPNIAGCSGGWSIVGVTTPESMQPACNRISGNDSANPNGTGCNVEDLCAQGWYVCHGAMDVQQHSATGQCDPSTSTAPEFWLTRQVQTTQGECSQPPDTNNVVGCGTLGEAIATASCQPLNRRMKAQDCIPTAYWYCGSSFNGNYVEGNIIRKDAPGEGGVLCCKQ